MSGTPAREHSLPTRSYLVCASQRSGTTLLCRALTDTGLAGRPDEYFLAVGPEDEAQWPAWEHGLFGTRHRARDREDYLAIVYDLGTTPNGTFGAKLMWNNLRWAVAKFQEMPRFRGLDRVEVLRAAFPELRVVHVTRRDRARQAVLAVLDHLGIDTAGVVVPPPRTDRQADELNEAWVTRYRTEHL
jgi:LPS sulfotransferase NodH